MKLNSSSAPGVAKRACAWVAQRPARRGKTCGRGVKGQRARKFGYHKVGRRRSDAFAAALPKVGFRSKMATTVAEVRLSSWPSWPVMW
jgi:large subunit ribosomal protein L15